MQIKANRLALKVALIYVSAAAGWILSSDELVKKLVSDPDTRVNLSILKGLGFVLLTGGLLYLALKRSLRGWEAEATERMLAKTAEHIAAEHLHQSEEQLRLVLEASADGLWDWNLKTGVAYLSPRYCEITGYAAEEVVANLEFYRRLVHPADWPAVQAAVNEHLAGNTAHSVIEYRMITKDGSVKWIWGRGKVVERTPDGAPLRMVGTISDITERKRTEVVLQLSDFSVNHVSLPTFWIAPDARIIRANHAACAQLGYTEAELLQRAITDLDPDFPKERWPTHWHQLRELKHYCFETRHRHKAGHVIPVEVEVNWFEFGGQEYNFAYARDITERKRAEAARQELTDQLSQAQRLSRLGSYSFDIPTGQWTSSEVLDELFGLGGLAGKKDVTGWLQIVHPADRSEMQHYLLEEVLAGHCQFDRKYRIVRQNDQQERWVHGLGKLKLDEQGQVVQMLGTIQDITERHRMECLLAHERDLLGALMDNLPDHIYFKDANSRFTRINRALCRHLGLANPEDAIGKCDGDFFPAADAGQKLSDEQALLVGGKPILGLIEKSETARETRWESSTKVAIYDANGEISGLVGVSRDITRRIHAEAALSESQALYQSLMTQLPVGVFRKDEHGHYVLVNPAFCLLKGVHAQDFLGKTPAEVHAGEGLHPGSGALSSRYAAQGEEHHRRIMETGETIELEEECRPVDGQKRFVQVIKFPVLNQAGKVIGSQGVLFDITERKKSEAQLRKLSRTVEQTPVAVVITDITGKIEYVNLAFTVVTGYRADEAVGENPRMLKSGNTPREVYKDLWATIVAGRTWDGELQNRKKNGELFWERAVISPLLDPAGKVTHYIAMKEDITERKQSEALLRASEMRLRFVTENTHVGLVVVNAERRYTFANSAYTEILGLPSSNIIGQRLADILGPLYEEQIRPRLDCAFAGERVAYELRKTAANGDRFYAVTYEPSQVEDAERLVVVVIIEITERKQKEDELIWQTAQLEAQLEAAPDGILVVDNQARKVLQNQQLLKLFQVPPVIARDPDDSKLFQHVLGQVKNPTQFVERVTFLYAHPDEIGREEIELADGRILDRYSAPVYDRTETYLGRIWTFRDITKSRQLESQLQQAQKMEAIGTLAGGIAHDFNNILASTCGYGYLLQQDTEGNAAAQENLAEIMKAASRAKDLVQQILTFSRQREQKRLVIPLDNVVKEATKFLRASLPAQIRIDVQIAVDAPTVLADATQIYQVTMNLATNALHAMEGRPGKLNVSLSAFRPTAAFIQANPEIQAVEYALLTVADTGQGMDAKTLARIYDPFFTTKPVGKGTGLGLAVVHGIVRSHDGVIMVESEVDRGTTFRLFFPAQMNSAALADANTGPAVCGHGQNILLVDDELALTAPLQKLLCRLNYQVVTSNSAREAVRLVQANPSQFDLVITDLTMPEMNGLEVARQIRVIRPDLPVVLTSGLSSSVSAESLREAGVRELLEKPVSLTALAGVVQRTLAGQ